TSRYPEPARRTRFLDEVLARVRTAPGVSAAGAVSFLPLCGWSSSTSFVDPEHPGVEREAGYQVADPGYFAALRIPVVRGRAFRPDDDGAAPRVIVVDERFVRRSLGGREPLGVRFDFGERGAPEWRSIVGVAGDVEAAPPPAEQEPTVYVPFAQSGWPV